MWRALWGPLMQVLCVLGLMGCSFMKPTLRPEYVSVDNAPAAAPVPASEVAVFNVRELEPPLPEGIRVRMGPQVKLSERLEVDASYPTPEDPHRMMGGVHVKRGGYVNEPDALSVLAEEAGRHGANALIVVEERFDYVTALTFRLSSAQPRLAWPTAAELINTEVDYLDGFSQEGGPVTRQLQAFQPVALNAKEGRCYGLIFALDTGAAFTRHARRGLGFAFTSPDGIIAKSEGMIGTDLPLSKRSHAKRIGCPRVDGPLEVDLQAQFGLYRGATPEQLHDLGTGPIVIQLYSRPDSAAARDSRDAERRRQMREAQPRNQNQARDACFACSNARSSCSGPDPAQCKPFTDCLATRATRVEECK